MPKKRVRVSFYADQELAEFLRLRSVATGAPKGELLRRASCFEGRFTWPGSLPRCLPQLS